jgi:GT2 family glycosyltransferase
MVIGSDAEAPKRRSALQVAVALNAQCPPPARIGVAAGDDYLAGILRATGYEVGEAGEAAGFTACAVAPDAPGDMVEAVLAKVVEGGVLVHGAPELGDAELAQHGFSRIAAGGGVGVSLALKGVAGSRPADAPDASVLPEPGAALDALERRLTEKLDRLALQNTHLVNALDRLTYAVSLKGRMVGLLRRTGMLETAGSVLNRVRRVRGAIARYRSKAAGPVAHMSSGVAVFGPVLVASASPAAAEIEASAKRKQVGIVRVKPAARKTEADASLLERPESDSLPGWLAQYDRPARSAVRTVMIDLDDGTVGLNLLRGQLAPEQSLLLVRDNEQAELPAELGPPDAVKGLLAFYATAPGPLRTDAGESARRLADGPRGREWPKISMVMVSFNQAAFLEEGIKSILSQDYPNLEFILIDGGSTDGSADIIERYRDRLDVVVIERDRGQSDGLNKGFDRATGEILSWLNSDDLLLPGALFQVASAFRHYEADMIVGGCRQVLQNGVDVVVSHHTHLPFGQKVALPLDELLDFDNRWQGGAFFYQPEVFFSREIWLRSGGGLRLDLYYVLDYDLWIRMAAAGATIAHIPDFLAASRIHDQQKTTFGENPFIPETRRLLAEYSAGVHWTRPSGA